MTKTATMPLIRFLLLAMLLPALPGASQGQANLPDTVMLDDFESYDAGGLPVRWSYLHDRSLEPLTEAFMRENERFTVVRDGRNKVLRVYTKGEAVHLTLLNEPPHMNWDLTTHPVLAWDWRANTLPPGAREDNESLNDSAAGIYVVFSFEGFIVKRPKTIKYVYSSTLPEGTVVSYGKLKVIVVSSSTTGKWQRIERNVMEDYVMVFGGTPPDKPISVRLWGDSDNTGGEGEVDFDNIRLKRDNL